MTDVKVFTDKQTDKRTDQKLCDPDLSMRGHKKKKNALSNRIDKPGSVFTNYSSKRS